MALRLKSTFNFTIRGELLTHKTNRLLDQAKSLQGCRVSFRCAGEKVVGKLLNVIDPAHPDYRRLRGYRGVSSGFVQVEVAEAMASTNYFSVDRIVGDIEFEASPDSK